MLRRRVESPRKVELVSIIDVVFLLLIFFIVTTTFMRGLGGGRTDEVLDRAMVPDTRSNELVEVDAGIVLYPFSNDGTEDIDYYIFSPCANWEVLNQIINNMGPLNWMRNNRGTLQMVGPGTYNIYSRPSQLMPCLRGKSRVAIRAAETIPWGEVMKVYDLCKRANPQMKIIFMIAPREQLFGHIRSGPPIEMHECG